MMRAVVALASFIALTAACVPTSIAGPTPPVVGLVASPTNTKTQIIRGSKQASTEIDINDAVAVPLDESTTWTVVVDLPNEGPNDFAVQTRDGLGQVSSVVDVAIVVDTQAPDPPVIDPLPPTRTQDAVVTLQGTLPSAALLVVDGNVAPVDASTFSLSQALPFIGDNLIRLASRDAAGNESAIVEIHVERAAEDHEAPDLTIQGHVDTPVDGQFVRDSVVVSGTAIDASTNPITITVCAGRPAACPASTGDGTLSSFNAGAGGVFSGVVDVSALVDDASDAISIVATDEWGNASDPVVRTILRAGGPGFVTGNAPSAVALTSGTSPFDVDAVWLDGNATLELSHNSIAPFSPQTSQVATSAQHFAAARTSSTTTIAWSDALALHVKPAASATSVETAILATSFTIGDVALAVDAIGDFAVAAVDADNHSVIVSSRLAANQWSAPVAVSDAVTASAATAPTQVAIALRDDGDVVVAWAETSARDGTADDPDVVAVLANATTGALSNVVLVSQSAGSFTDGRSSAPRLASLGNTVALAWLDSGDAWLASLDDAAFTAGATAAPSLVVRSVDDVALASNGASLALAAHDPQQAVLVFTGAPDAVATASPTIVPSSKTAPSTSIAYAGGVAHVGFVDGSARVFVYPLEIGP